ncbi:MAG: helix-turn-helix domain-containing protein [Clostridiales bacterium]|jgi:transcriptional regulator with XRE-family HTH domain|nr:helix-turn-helix transcriptional regulator [Clostridia bacterium]MCR4885106.1 helix-turn-helix domain-containing protein [Clostridiales bacterium]
MPRVVINMKRTGENILSLRAEKGMSAQDLAVVLGFSTPHTIYRWQKGETLPSVDSLVVLSEIFEVSMNEIIAVDPVP